MMNINGINIEVPNGSTVTVNSNGVFVNGKKYESEELKNKEVVKLVINGNVGNVECTCDVKCGDVYGNVKAGRDVDCIDVSQGVTAGRDIDADAINGYCHAGRDIIKG